MNEGLRRLAEEMRPLAGQMVLLYDSEIVRFLGVAEDSSDLYYVVRGRRGGPYWSSAVGHISALHGVLPDDVYERMDGQFVFNEVIGPLGRILDVGKRPFCILSQRGARVIALEGEVPPSSGQDADIAFDREADSLGSVAFSIQYQSDRVFSLAEDALRAAGGADEDVSRLRSACGLNLSVFGVPAQETPIRARHDALVRIGRSCRGISEDEVHLFSLQVEEGLESFPEARDAFRKNLLALRPGGNRMCDGLRVLSILRGVWFQMAEPGIRAPETSDEDDAILEAISAAWPFFETFYHGWISANPHIGDLMGAYPEAPIWAGGARFSFENRPDTLENPGLIGLSPEQAGIIMSADWSGLVLQAAHPGTEPENA